MLDLCCGLGGASAPMRRRGWRVVRVDINPDVSPDYCADIRSWQWDGDRPRLIWASPPCDEFSREDKPWTKTGNLPDLSIVKACIRLIDEIQPDYWAIENVRGAVPYFAPLLGKPSWVCHPYYLWGNLPPLPRRLKFPKKGDAPRKNRALVRAVIPFSLATAVADVCEGQQQLFRTD